MSSNVQDSRHDIRGSLWNRWDLHFHTPASYDYQDSTVTNQQIVDGLVAAGVRVVAITDHHIIDVQRIRDLQKLAGEQLTVLPGIELRSDQGGTPIHYICIFPEDNELEYLWTTLQGSLGLTKRDIEQKGGDDKVYVPLENAAQLTRGKLNGVVSIHAGSKSNSIEGIKNHEQFQQQIKLDITRQWIDMMEVGQIKDIDVHLHKIFPSISLFKPLIICSDNHAIGQYSVKSLLWIRADPTFRGLRMALKEPQERIFIGSRPLSTVRVTQNPTRYIKKIEFYRHDNLSASDKWFSGHIQFNPGLVAIIGNKGSGKSALADILGLLGATKNSDSFSFLNNERFLHPVRGKASFFDAALEWWTGDSVRKNLATSPSSEDVERVRYLPQQYVETVCNELADGREGSFEKELKSVIFSHVPETRRLGQQNLDDLVRFQTDEKQRRIDSLLGQLRDICRSRSITEAKADPRMKKEIEGKINQRKDELNAHIEAKPTEIPSPAESDPESSSLLDELAQLEQKSETIEEQIRQTIAKIREVELQKAQSVRLTERLRNFGKEVDTFIRSFSSEAENLGLKVEELITFRIDAGPVIRLQNELEENIRTTTEFLDTGEPRGLRTQLRHCTERMDDLQAQLDAPNRAYQAYRRALEDWEDKKNRIEGDTSDPESLNGLVVTLAGYEELPEQIKSLQQQQINIALEIHIEKLAQSEVFRTLYGPVQEFIDGHPLAKEKIRLEFRTELTNVGFEDRLLNLLAQNRRGSFMGTDEGRERATRFAQVTDWADPESVKDFLVKVDYDLHFDVRSASPEPTLLTDQLLKGKQPEEVYNVLYGLDYVQPKYVLRWDGKDLAMLSPGQRGTLLLIFYLLIDKTETPLIIDQPEGNLDNHTVVKILVDCIKDARKRRQVFIVTHNPNLAVVCDADQVIYAEMDINDGNRVTYTCGSLENPRINRCVTDVLEGTRVAFDVRGDKYDVIDL